MMCHTLLDFESRGHCLSSDPVISLARRHRGEEGRLIVTYGSGLGVCLLREERVAAAPAALAANNQENSNGT